MHKKFDLNILLIHGPNLQLLGKRQPEIYGTETLDDINDRLLTKAKNKNIDLRIFQSNSEGEIVSKIGENIEWADGILINPAAYTHTSVAIRDALSSVDLPVIEIHLSNVHKREDFRHHSYVSPIATGIIVGFGSYSYDLALEAILQMLNSHRILTKG